MVYYFYLEQLVQKGWAEDEDRYAYLMLKNRKEEAEAIEFGPGARPEFRDFFQNDVTGAPLTIMDKLKAGMYEEVLKDTAASIGESVPLSSARIHCLVMLARYNDAMQELLPYLSQVPLERSWMRYLAVLAEKLTGELGQIAETILLLNRRYYQRFRDWGGVVRREYAVDVYDKKTLRRLQNLSEERLIEDIKADGKEFATEGLLDYAEKAAAIYERKRMHAMALDCWRFAFAHGRDDARSGMGRAIAALSK